MTEKKGFSILQGLQFNVRHGDKAISDSIAKKSLQTILLHLYLNFSAELCFHCTFFFLTFSFPFLVLEVSGFKPSTCECPTTVALPLVTLFLHYYLNVIIYLPLFGISSIRSQTLDIGMMRRVFYCCAITACQNCFHSAIFFIIFILNFWC